jgi:ABC-type nitrate/sulfonate/bicarbonate transport system substrate-binding protein
MPTSGHVLRLGYFSVSVVSRLARATDAYSGRGLDVVEHAVSSSSDQFRRLLEGELDLLLTSPDNVLTYRVNPGNPLGTLADVRIIRAVDRGLGLSLLAGPDAEGVESLRGARIGVDVPNSGFAYALFAILARHGLSGADYELVTLGSTPRRAAALRAGECDATLLNAGHDVLAELDGAVRLARVSTSLGPYIGTVLAARADWLEQNNALVADFVDAWKSAVDATLDPASRPLVEAEIGGGLDAEPDAVSAIYDTLLDPAEGLVPDGELDSADWARIVDLRGLSGGFDPGVDVADVRANPPVAAGRGPAR